MRPSPLSFLMLLPLALSGCGGEVSWKRGAREQDWAADRATCAQRKDFVDCMAARGWSVKNLGDGREAAGSEATAVFFDPDAAMAGSDAAASPVAGDSAVTTAAPPQSSTTQPSAGAATPPVGPVTIAPSPDGIPRAMPSPQTLARIEGTAPGGQGSSGATKATASPAPRDPLDRVEVNSWWKLGGRAGEVDAATEACVKKLGPEHAPEGPRYTLGTLSCLKEKGWRALTVSP